MRLAWRYPSGIAVAFCALAAACGSGSRATPTASTAQGPLVTLVAHDENGVNTGPGYAGQSLTLTDGPVTDLRFNWRTRLDPTGTTPIVGTAPTAVGTVYVLNQEYGGTAAELSTSTPGFIARSERIENSEYRFASAVVLQAGKYWFYADTPQAITTGNGDRYAGGDSYYVSSPNVGFVRFAVRTITDFVDTDFRLQGRRTTTQ